MSSSAKFAFIFNPTADRKRARRALEWLQSSVKKHFPKSEIFVSDNAGHATELAQNASRSFDAVIACGGDGTIQEVASGLIASGGTLGIIPMGSGNDFVKSTEISGKKETAMLQLLSAQSKPIDVISFEADGKAGICVNTLGMGFDGLINYESMRIKRWKGSLVYVLSVLRSVNKMKPVFMQILADGVTRNETLLLLSLANGSTEGGNFRIAPNARLHDGLIDIVMIKPVTRIGLLFRLGLFLFGQQHRSSKISTFRCREIEVEAEAGLPVHADGEHLGLEIKRMKARILPGSINLLIPSQ